MKANQVKDSSPIKANKEGNDVYVKELPEFIEDTKGNAYKFHFVEVETQRVFSPRQFDPFNTKPDLSENLVSAGFNRLFRFYRAFMPKEVYEQFADIDFQDLKTCIATGNKMVAPDWANTKATILLGNSLYNGFPSLPAFAEFISTDYCKVSLEYPEGDLSVDYVANPTIPRTSKAAPKPDKETGSASKSNVNDEV